MRLALGIAGIPREIFDDVMRESRRFAEGAHLFAEPLRGAAYTPQHAEFFARKFYDLVATDHENKLRDTGFALIYVVRDETSTDEFRASFFPFALAVPIVWRFRPGRPDVMRLSKNELLPMLELATRRARDTLNLIRSEVGDRAGHTPLLLPVRNFQSTGFERELRALQAGLAVADDKRAELTHALDRLRALHPPQRIGQRLRNCFVDDRRVEFHPPGSARHGYARPSGQHPRLCLLSGRRRLGAPYDHAFHYDCVRGGGVLRDSFTSCHDAQATLMRGNPHLNISPNDHVRA
jgi:hypothetical protein